MAPLLLSQEFEPQPVHGFSFNAVALHLIPVTLPINRPLLFPVFGGNLPSLVLFLFNPSSFSMNYEEPMLFLL